MTVNESSYTCKSAQMQRVMQLYALTQFFFFYFGINATYISNEVVVSTYLMTRIPKNNVRFMVMKQNLYNWIPVTLVCLQKLELSCSSNFFVSSYQD